ncbi:hypothetical protein BC826DRAFT_968733 [Russula brevipes]|nr:hypothetical protein BC826DRAFT_968733 [Russula brevipes]
MPDYHMRGNVRRCRKGACGPGCRAQGSARAKARAAASRARQCACWGVQKGTLEIWRGGRSGYAGAACIDGTRRHPEAGTDGHQRKRKRLLNDFEIDGCRANKRMADRSLAAVAGYQQVPIANLSGVSCPFLVGADLEYSQWALARVLAKVTSRALTEREAVAPINQKVMGPRIIRQSDMGVGVAMGPIRKRP